MSFHQWMKTLESPGSRTTNGINKPDMFLNLVEGTMCSVFDVDTTGEEPQATLEVYRGGVPPGY